jgi:uncharacterized membrane protein YqhA
MDPPINFTGKHRIIYIAVILGMHLLLAAGFMLYFFHPYKNVEISNVAEIIVSTTEQVNIHKVAQNNSLNAMPTTAS